MATGTEEFIDLTTVDVFLEEKWSKYVTAARDEEMVFAKNVNTDYRGDLKKGQILRIQNKSHLAARTKSANTAITFETVKGLVSRLFGMPWQEAVLTS